MKTKYLDGNTPEDRFALPQPYEALDKRLIDDINNIFVLNKRESSFKINDPFDIQENGMVPYTVATSPLNFRDEDKVPEGATSEQTPKGFEGNAEGSHKVFFQEGPSFLSADPTDQASIDPFNFKSDKSIEEITGFFNCPSSS